MKTLFISLCIGSASMSAFSQDSMQTNRSSNMNMGDRIAARDMTGAMTPPALPVMHTFVPPEVMTQVGSKYGKTLYAVTMLKVGGGTDAYQVMILDNQTPRFEWIGADGSAVANIYRVDTGAMATDAMNTMSPTTPSAPMNSTVPMNNNANRNMDSAARMNNPLNNNATMRTDSSQQTRMDSSQMNSPTMRTDTSQNARRDSLGTMGDNPGMRRDTSTRRGMDTTQRRDTSSSMRFNKGGNELMLTRKHFAPFQNQFRNTILVKEQSAFYRRDQSLTS